VGLSARVAPRFAYALLVVYGVLAVGATALAQLGNGRLSEGSVLYIGLSLYAVIGALLASLRPRNPIGWLFLCAPLSAAVGVFSDELAIYGLVTAPGTIPVWIAQTAAWLATWVWMGNLAPLVFVVLLFPSGRLPSERWRPIGWAIAISFLVFTFIFALGTPGNQDHPEIKNPLAIQQLVPLGLLIQESFGVFIFIFGLAVLSIVARYRAATALEKQQLKWIVMAGVFMVIAFTAGSALPSPIADFGFIAALVALPIAIAIAILRHRLYDIDVLINRTIVYTGLTVALGATFFGGLVLLQGLLRPVTGASELGVALSTLVSFTLFQPLRRAIQTAVDQRFNRRTYDAERTVDSFSSRLSDEIDLDALRGDLVAVVRNTMAPAHVSVWLRERPE
jgi:hypothetical protein